MLRKSALFLCFAVFIPAASADTIQLTLTGSVAGSNLAAVSAGQALTITLKYDSTIGTQSIQNHQGFHADAMTSISIDAGPNYSSGYSGMFGQIDQFDNLGGADGIQFEAAANPATYQFSTAHAVSLNSIAGGGAFDYIFVNLASDSGALWSGYSLPVSYTFSDFDQTRNFALQFASGGFSGGITSFSVVDLTTSATPEPATWALAGLSLIGLAIRRRG